MTAGASCVPSTRGKPSSSRATACLSASWFLCDSACSFRLRRCWPLSAEPRIAARRFRGHRRRSSIRIRLVVADSRRPRGLIDTSVLFDLERVDPARLPLELAISAVTMAELAAGPHATVESSRACAAPGPAAACGGNFRGPAGGCGCCTSVQGAYTPQFTRQAACARTARYDL